MDIDRIRGGYDIHVYYNEGEAFEAFDLYTDFLTFLYSRNIRPSYYNFYKHSDMPHIPRSFVVHLMGNNPVRDNPVRDTYPGDISQLMYQIGTTISWLSMNRKNFTVFIHPNVALPFGDVKEEINDHYKRSIILSNDFNYSKIISREFFDLLMVSGPEESRKIAMRRLSKL